MDKISILVVDDEEALLKNIGDFFKAKGWTVFSSKDGDAGIELLKSHNPQVMVLDLHLKEGPTGVEVLRMAKMLKPDLKVIVFTGFGEEEAARDSCMSFGASAFLSKPTSLRNLTETIENLLGQKMKEG